MIRKKKESYMLMLKNFTGFKNSPRFKAFLQQMKINLIFMAVGLALLMALGIGFIIMILFVISIPIIRWWIGHKIVKTNPHKKDYIEVDYQVVDEEKKKK
jgi:hypothetical protein